MLGSTAWALGRLGSVEYLQRAIHNDQIQVLNRAMAITALGILSSRDPQPWNAELARNLNYRAAVETLTTRAAPPGILDLY